MKTAELQRQLLDEPSFGSNISDPKLAQRSPEGGKGQGSKAQIIPKKLIKIVKRSPVGSRSPGTIRSKSPGDLSDCNVSNSPSSTYGINMPQLGPSIQLVNTKKLQVHNMNEVNTKNDQLSQVVTKTPAQTNKLPNNQKQNL